MPAKNKFYKTFYTETEFKNYISKLMVEWIAQYMAPIRKRSFDRGLDAGTAYGIDMAVLALGRMGEGATEAKTCENCARYNISCVPNDQIEQECARRGREGWYPKKVDISDPEFFVNFMNQVSAASSDYCDLFEVDVTENNDEELWWSGSKLDEELYRYVSRDIYPEFEKRYKREYVSESVKSTAP